MGENARASLDTQAGLAPVTTLSVVPDSLVSPSVPIVRSLDPVGEAVESKSTGPLLPLIENFGRYLPDGVASAQANPLRDGTVLALSLSKLLLGAEGLVALCGQAG